MRMRIEGRTRVLVASPFSNVVEELVPHGVQDFSLKLEMSSGLGVSVVSAELAEILYLHTRAIVLTHHRHGADERTQLTIKQIQVPTLGLIPFSHDSDRQPAAPGPEASGAFLPSGPHRR